MMVAWNRTLSELMKGLADAYRKTEPCDSYPA